MRYINFKVYGLSVFWLRHGDRRMGAARPVTGRGVLFWVGNAHLEIRWSDSRENLDEELARLRARITHLLETYRLLSEAEKVLSIVRLSSYGEADRSYGEIVRLVDEVLRKIARFKL